MEDMLPETDAKKSAAALADLLSEHRGENVCVIDLRGICNWTDFFVVATVTSRTHMDGLNRHIKEYCGENGIGIFGSSGKNNDEQWRLIDLGSIVIHLMTSETRDFYDLERLWAPIPKT